jgi:hypothetical protein
LEKIGGPVAFATRSGSASGTQEARLPENAGLVQAAGSPGNLSVVVFWAPVDAKGKLASVKSRQYMEAFVDVFAKESGPLIRWVEHVLERAVAEGGSTPHLESQFLEDRQFKATYVPTLSPPMLSLAVQGGGQGAPR